MIRSPRQPPGRSRALLAALCACCACGEPELTGNEREPSSAVAETPSGRALALRGVDRAAHDSPQLVVQLTNAPSAALRARFGALGFRELAYLGANTLVLERGRGDASALAALGEVRGVGPYLAADRVSRELTRDVIGERGDDAVPLLVQLVPEHDGAAVRALLAARGLSLLGSGTAGSMQRLSVELPRRAVAELAEALSASPDVFFVERIHHLGFFNDRSAGSVQSGMQGSSEMATPIWAHGLRGQGEVVGLIDSGLDVDSCFFADAQPDKLPKTNTWSAASGYGVEVDTSHRKVIAYDFLYSCDQWPSGQGCERPTQLMQWDNHGHGTHCSGSMVGNRPGARNNGVAPDAKIVVQDGGTTRNTCSEMPGLGCPVIDLYPIFKQAYQQGVRVHNNSYGDNEEAPPPNQSNYTARSQDVDRFMWDHKDMLIVFAAGNSGMSNRDFSVGSPSTNKNGLSVGSVRTAVNASSDEDLSSFSSRGLTADGRFKPDIVAPGCTVSAGNDTRIGSNNCGEDQGCGTSYAAPVLVGAAALARQYFREGFYPSGERRAGDALMPSAALLKAVLLNGAVGLRGRDNAGQSIAPIPSQEQGFGRVQLDRALYFQGGARKLFVDDHARGFAAGSQDSVRYVFKNLNAREPLKVTLAWTDYPGAPDSPPRLPSVGNLAALNAPRLVNDLDLSVEIGGNTYLGNAFMNGQSASGGQPDRRNNVEQVLVASGAGDAVVLVKAASIAQTAQDFALVVSGAWERVGDDALAPMPALDAGSMSAPPLSADAGRDAASATQTVRDPIVTDGAGAPESGVAGAPSSGPDAGTALGGPAREDAGGCDCRAGTSRGSDGLSAMSWLGLVLYHARRRRLRGRAPSVPR